MGRLFALLALCTLALLQAMPGRAFAQSYETAVQRFAADSFAETGKAVAELRGLGDPRGVTLLEALADRRLFAVKGAGPVFYKDAKGQSFDALTGASTPIPDAAAVVRVNNKLRSEVQSALGAMTLLSSDPAQRRAAAEAVLKARNPDSLPVIDAALSKESDPAVTALLKRARAAIVLLDARALEPERVAAANLLAHTTDADTLSLLKQAQASTDGAVKAAVDRGVASIEAAERWRSVGQTVWFGISLGSVLLLAAIGLAITFGVMGVINLAHGEMVMIGAYVTFVVQEAMRSYAPGLLDWSLPIAIPLAFIVAGAIGIAIERFVISHLYGRPLETLLATFGVSLILQQAVRTWFGPTNREVSAPSYMSGSFEVLGLQITYGRLWIVLFTLAVFAVLLVVLKATPLGLQMRAVTQNRRMASSMGIRTRFVDAMTFGLGSGIAGIAGVALSQIDNVSPNLGQGYLIDSFMVVVFGGVGNLWGTLVAAFTLGIANKLLEPFAGAVLAKILILVLLILFIQKRPRGLFALKGRAVEQ